MRKLDFRTTYSDLVCMLKKSHIVDQAMHRVVGGEFEAFGMLHRELLIQYGLRKDGYVID